MSSAKRSDPHAVVRHRLRGGLLDLCYERGYQSVDLELLLGRAGVDRPAFDALYADLEDCFCELYEEVQDSLYKRVDSAIAGLPRWRDRLRTTAYTMLTYLAEDEKRAHLLVVDGGLAGERVQRVRARSFAYVFELLDQAREDDEESHLSRATAEAIGGAVFLQMYAAFEEGSVGAVREKIPAMMHAAVLPYLGSEAAAEELRLEPPELPRRP